MGCKQEEGWWLPLEQKWQSQVQPAEGRGTQKMWVQESQLHLCGRWEESIEPRRGQKIATRKQFCGATKFVCCWWAGYCVESQPMFFVFEHCLGATLAWGMLQTCEVLVASAGNAYRTYIATLGGYSCQGAGTANHFCQSA